MKNVILLLSIFIFFAGLMYGAWQYHPVLFWFLLLMLLANVMPLFWPSRPSQIDRGLWPQYRMDDPLNSRYRDNVGGSDD